MSDPLTDSAERLFSDHADRAHPAPDTEAVFPDGLWHAVTEAGFPAALLPEESGGFGLTAQEALSIVRIAAAHTAAIPLAETMLAGWLLAGAGLPVPDGPLSLSTARGDADVEVERRDGRWLVTGELTRVPWGRSANGLALHAASVEGTRVVLVPSDQFTWTPGINLAGEPRDDIVIRTTLDDALVSAPGTVSGRDQLRLAGAVMRTIQISGAIARVLALSVSYAQTRVQFGRPIGQFQAIQHSLAQMAGQVAAAGAAADMAVEAFATDLDPMTVGAAKARAGEAASLVAAIAHQVHGAIGFTHEYSLHLLTRRLWSWRDEFGNEAHWHRLVGRAALKVGADGLWPLLTEAA